MRSPRGAWADASSISIKHREVKQLSTGKSINRDRGSSGERTHDGPTLRGPEAMQRRRTMEGAIAGTPSPELPAKRLHPSARGGAGVHAHEHGLGEE